MRSSRIQSRMGAGLLVAVLALGVSAGRAEEGPPESSGPSGPALDLDDEALLEELEAEEQVSDPLEPWNRGVFQFNRLLDLVLFDPVARTYGWLVPDPGRRAVRRMFTNLDGPVVIVNDLLQLRPRRAGEASARLLLNTTLGLAGLFDPAATVGLEAHHADFGQTLGWAGLGSGPYLVFPVLGPSNARDAVGTVVDGLLRVDTWLLWPAGRLVLFTGAGLATKEAHLEELEELQRGSLDPYVTLRGVYLMSREAVIRDAVKAGQADVDGNSDGGPGRHAMLGGDG